MLPKVIRTTFWTRFDQTVRSDEVKERIKVRNVDAKEEAKRHENEVASSTASTMWIKDHDEIQFQNTGWYCNFACKGLLKNFSEGRGGTQESIREHTDGRGLFK